MKKIYFVFILGISLLSILPVHSGIYDFLEENAEIDLELKWSHLFTRSFDQDALQIISTSDGGYLIGGNSALNSVGNDKELWILKLDSDGNEQWNTSTKYYLNPHSNLRSVIQTPDGGFAMTGLTGSTSDYASWDVWVLKINANGIEQWNHTYNGVRNGPDYGSQILVAPDGGFLIAGATQSVTAGAEIWNTDYWLIKTDTNGIEQWNKTYNRLGSDQVFSFVPLENNQYILGGLSRKTSYSENPSSDHIIWLIKIDETGSPIWNKTYESSEGRTGIFENNLVGTSDGGFLLASFSMAENYYMGKDFWIIKADSSGEVEWEKTFGGNDFDTPMVSVETSKGNYLVGGAFDSKTGDKETGDMGIIKLNTSGGILWDYKYGEVSKSDRISDMILVEGDNSKDELVVLAETESFGADGIDIWIAKYGNVEAPDNGGTSPGFSTVFLVFSIPLVLIYKRKINKKH